MRRIYLNNEESNKLAIYTQKYKKYQISKELIIIPNDRINEDVYSFVLSWLLFKLKHNAKYLR